jgi:ABC-type uncharacterized transport system auxiliary subunit
MNVIDDMKSVRFWSAIWVVALLCTALLCTALLCTAAVGCGGSAPEIKHYRLDLEPTQADVAAGDKPVLGIEPFTTDAAYDDAQIVYRSSPYQLNYYYYHRWAATPGLLLTDALRRGYAATGRFRSVTAGQMGRSDVVLSGHIAAIEEVDVSEDKWVGRVVLELRLRDARTGDVLWSRMVEEQESLAERTPAGLAEAVSAAVTRIVEATASEITTAARQSTAG